MNKEVNGCLLREKFIIVFHNGWHCCNCEQQTVQNNEFTAPNELVQKFCGVSDFRCDEWM